MDSTTYKNIVQKNANLIKKQILAIFISLFDIGSVFLCTHNNSSIFKPGQNNNSGAL